MVESDDPRLSSPQFSGTVTNLEDFKKEKARKKASGTSQDAKIIDFPAASDDANREAAVRSRMTEEEKDKEPPMHKHDCPDDEGA